MNGNSTGSAHGKLLLFGEHAAVYGRAACGITLPSTMTVSISTVQGAGWLIAPSIGPLTETLLAFLGHAERLFSGRDIHRGSIDVESDIPIGMGFGSSAAWCGAFARAALGPAVPLAELWEAAHRAEGFFHGTPSGIDTGLALLDGLFAFAPAPPALPKARRLGPFPLHLVVGAAPREGSTRELVGALRVRIESGDREAQALVDELGGISEHAIEILAAGDPRAVAELGALANRAQTRLASLGLSTPIVDEVIGAGTQLGALGAKLSGAGGGGAFYLLFRDAPSADRALAELRARFATADGTTVVRLFRYSPPVR